VVTFARKGIMSSDALPYECKYEWGCFVQCGDNGVVFVNRSMQESFLNPLETLAVAAEGKESEVYFTAFFEAFPRNPDTFIRGEGKTVLEAEEEAWTLFQKYSTCTNHEFEARGYENGGGFCKHCNMFSGSAIAPTHKCPVCDTPTWFTKDADGNFWCEEHRDEVPEDKMTESQKRIREMTRQLDSIDA
jgi:hypothetical protein